MIYQIAFVDSRKTSSDVLTAFKIVSVSSNLTMTLSFWYIFSSKDFKS